ncbi:MAG: protein translocase subunit SecD [Candidatus Omnitrophica bacterium]|nr:protein translocase subunit SecD [Candidatus Omnitrophota bacterium]
MHKNFKWKVVLIIGIVAFLLWKIYPPQEKISLGLDLQGGMHLVLQVELDKIPEEARKDAVARAVEVIRNRIDEFGVREPSIQPQGVDKIIIQLPGITDRKRALDIIGRTAHLEFRLVAENSVLSEAVKKKGAEEKGADEEKVDGDTKETKALEVVVPEGYEFKTLVHDKRNEETLLLEKKPILTGDKLVTAGVQFDTSGFGQPVVSLTFDKEGGSIFSDVTQEALRKFRSDGNPRRLAIVLDGKICSAPQMKQHIPSGKAVIEGNFNYDEASDLALILRAGALPAPVIVAEERSVGPTLGQDSITKGIKSTLCGFAAVILIIAVYYLLCGMVAIFALLLNIVIIMGSLACFGAALTLPGIAGIILTIGMSVDANVLVFERIREELKTGKTTRSAISSGYHRAFGTILDANITTLIPALLLFYFGTGPIKGFAVTLSIGLVSSMFTALFVTRVIFDFLTRERRELNLKMLSLFSSEPNVNFVSKRFIAFGISIIIIAVGLISFFMRGEKNYGIDFTGGMLEQIKFHQEIDIGSVRNAFHERGIFDVHIQTFGDRNSNEIIVRTKGDTEEIVEQALETIAGKGNYEVLRVERVGPAVGSDLRQKAIKSIIFALIAILMYVGWRFRSVSYGVAAIIALFHDVLIAVGMLALTGREISLPIIAALLTIVGYSLNDTIVIFDRIREDVKLMKKSTFVDVVNKSINQTLARTILTSLTTLIVVVFLFIFGGQVINDFAFTLLVGIIVGTYSSVYIASPLIIGWGRKK